MTSVRARVVVLAGPSGSGKSRLAARLGLPVLNLDDFYRDGDDPTLPHRGMGPGATMPDWDDPGSWLHDEAMLAIENLCRHGEANVPVYDIALDARTGHRTLTLAESPYFVVEGIFAQEVVRDCRERGLLADAVCLHHDRVVTFWRRLSRDFREHRKPPLVLVRRGLRLLKVEPAIVAQAVTLGCAPLRPEEAYARITWLVESARRA